MGAKTVLISSDLDALGRMSCNPAVGGIAKGHLVREIDAMGGIIPLIADRTAIQYRVLNRSKGFAVWSPRAQCDRKLYSVEMNRLLKDYHDLELVEGTVNSVITGKDGRCRGVVFDDGRELTARAVILTCGTFLNGLIHCGEQRQTGGRIGEPTVTGLSDSLQALGIERSRLKTGTPPRLNGNTIDFDFTERQDGDVDPIFFSSQTTSQLQPHRPCWITHTNDKVHLEIRKGLDRSPLYCGRIKGVGPRYCPSIEDKIVRFPDRSRHIIFLEPEGLDTDEFYPNGFSTSLPIDIQLNALQEIPGLTHVEITRAGYAIEYDFFPPHQLKATLETKLAPNLYFAGQINGTSGYEEAAAQGLVAGANAALQASGDNRTLTFGRDEAYIGVLIDDLITRGTDEPYRMFTSRAEYRLKLRLDNAAARLTAKASKVGLVETDDYQKVVDAENRLKDVIDYLRVAKTIDETGQKISLFDLIKRPEISLSSVLAGRDDISDIGEDILSGRGEFYRRVEAEIKYSGYLKRQESRALELQRSRARTIPDWFDFSQVKGLSCEGREKLLRIRPGDLGQASNIPGITPADLAVLLVNLKRMQC